MHHGLFVQLFSYLKQVNTMAGPKNAALASASLSQDRRIRDVAHLPPGRRVQRARARRDGVAPNLARWKRTPS